MAYAQHLDTPRWLRMKLLWPQPEGTCRLAQRHPTQLLVGRPHNRSGSLVPVYGMQFLQALVRQCDHLLSDTAS